MAKCDYGTMGAYDSREAQFYTDERINKLALLHKELADR